MTATTKQIAAHFLLKTSTTLATTLTTALTATLAQHSSAEARVNIRDASYSRTDIDLDLSRSGHDDLKIERTYNSRSIHEGLFGFGWCTPFENRIRSLGDGRLALSVCGLSGEIIYKKKPGPKDQWVAENAAGETLIARPGLYLRGAEPGERSRAARIEEFEAQTGRLVGITDRAGRVLRLSYDQAGRLITVTARASGAVLHFHYENENVTRIDSKLGRVDYPLEPGAGQTIRYTYRLTNMTRAQASGAPGLEYSYDTLHNLTDVRSSGRDREIIRYDADRDRVLSVATPDGCKEKYAYKFPAPNLQMTEASRTCAGSLTQAKFTLLFSVNSTGRRYLSQMRVESPAGMTVLQFHPDFGQNQPLTTDGHREHGRSISAEAGALSPPQKGS